MENTTLQFEGEEKKVVPPPPRKKHKSPIEGKISKLFRPRHSKLNRRMPALPPKLVSKRLSPRRRYLTYLGVRKCLKSPKNAKFCSAPFFQPPGDTTKSNKFLSFAPRFFNFSTIFVYLQRERKRRMPVMPVFLWKVRGVCGILDLHLILKKKMRIDSIYASKFNF